MVKYLIIVDMQNDFIDGVLGSAEAQKIVGNVVNKINSSNYDKIFDTLDTHEDNYLDTHEGKYLPVEHCINATYGWLLNKDIRNALKNKDYQIITKNSFGSRQLISTLQMLTIENKGCCEVELAGVCTDICVVSNALMLRSAYPDIDISVDANCCAGTTPEKHEAALTVMKSCQINIEGEQSNDCD